MANPIQGYYSDIVLGKVDSSDQGYSFQEMEITFAETLKAGMLVKADGTPAATADAADAFGVIVDRDLVTSSYTMPRPFVVGTKYNLVVAVRGLTLNKAKLVFADGTAINAAAISALETKGLKITDKYFDGSVSIDVSAV